MSEGLDERSGRASPGLDADPFKLIHEALARLKFGGIQLTVHEGKLVQMEVTEKRRFS